MFISAKQVSATRLSALAVFPQSC